MAGGHERPGDDEYWVRPWSSVLFAGDLFAAIPFVEQPSETLVDQDGQGKHYLGPLSFAYGLLISPTCDMVDQRSLQVAHPYRVFVPVLPLSLIAENAPATATNVGLIRGRDTVVPYMYLPALPPIFEESAACLYRPTLLSDDELREVPRRIAQLGPEARRQLKIKLARYWARVDPDRASISGTERDEDRFPIATDERSAYDLDPSVSPEDIPVFGEA